MRLVALPDKSGVPADEPFLVRGGVKMRTPDGISGFQLC